MRRVIGDQIVDVENTSLFRLLIVGDGTVRTIPLQGERWVIGRAEDCCIILRDMTVSRRHLQLERRGSTFTFKDLGGANPVMLDGRPTQHGQLCPGQTLTIGLTRLLLQSRQAPRPITTSPLSTVVLSREVLDYELPRPAAPQSLPTAAADILERIEWTFADLGDLGDAAEPMLSLALNLTRRRRGFIARFEGSGPLEPLASLDLDGGSSPLQLTPAVIEEIRRVRRPHLLMTQEGQAPHTRLVIPLGQEPAGVVVLEQPVEGAPNGQELLQLAQSLGAVIWHRLQETSERQRLRAELQRLRFHGTVAHNALLTSTRLQEVRQSLRALAGEQQPIVLVGEEGTEREDLARYLHAESPRQKAPFVAWNPSRLRQWQHERELFGDERGNPGAVQRASGGTLFVDEWTSLDLALQQRLVRHLLRPGDATAPATALVLANTTPPPNPADADGGWAAELLESLGAPPIEIPPLRSDARDIIALAELFLSEMGTCPDGSPRLLTERGKRLLVTYAWPGNVRELRLVLESAAANAGNQAIAPRHLPEALVRAAEPAALAIPTLEEIERSHIADVMQRTGGNRQKAAQLLGIATSTLYEKLKRMQQAE